MLPFHSSSLQHPCSICTRAVKAAKASLLRPQTMQSSQEEKSKQAYSGACTLKGGPTARQPYNAHRQACNHVSWSNSPHCCLITQLQTFEHAMLCYALLCQICCALPCRAMTCCGVLCNATACCARAEMDKQSGKQVMPICRHAFKPAGVPAAPEVDTCIFR